MKKLFVNDYMEMVESKPSCRIISIDGTKYYLSFPYIQFYSYRMSNYFCISWSKESLSSKTQLYVPFLPNIDEYYKICWGPMILDDYRIEKKIETFWNSRFHIDTDWIGLRQLRTSSYKEDYLSLGKWHSLTIKHGNFITNANWVGRSKVARNVVPNIMGFTAGMSLLERIDAKNLL